MAKKRVEFKSHLIGFVIMNIFFIILNVAFSPSYYWFLWITVIWGFFIVAHGIKAYCINEDSMEEKEYQKLKNKQK